MVFFRWLSLCLFFTGVCPALLALEPREVFLLVNKAEPESQKIADYYCEMRKVPKENIIVLDVTTEDEISRKDYDTKIVTPVRTALKGKETQAKCLLSIYGMPLRVLAPLTAEQEQQLVKFRRDLESKRAELDKARKDKLPKEKVDPLEKEANDLQGKINGLIYHEAEASVDSELTLLWWEKYNLQRFLFNPLHWQRPKDIKGKSPTVIMTSRIDGPTPAIARRLITDAVNAEAKGLEGKVYVDARGLTKIPKGDSGWGLEGYDESMREMAALLKEVGKMDVTLENTEKLFPVKSCKDCALYCGWYSVANFVDCCEFVPGAIAWHLASYECLSLHKENNGWCRNLLLKGATVTLGPVAEPYSAAFPKPEEFFGFLATGKYTLVEAYARTSLFTSWMMVLIGDPLYNPYKKSPKLKEADVKPSPKWGRYISSDE
ncbi:TIGR03790 family protein [Telmatocola sphagniphila]|uniref:TIGR03790 family protein n=1 Tax=Telmatocola sphagniphila TaxID=1123043 RepID=A0A8E6B5K4_9BACT|nr:TIGR03790 family protein [Telmatocola sphagniphila]QVL30918.1 TIGR03790 family protein [Telmatocola sphagniphila]